MNAAEQQTARELVALDDAAIDPTGVMTLYLAKSLAEIDRMHMITDAEIEATLSLFEHTKPSAGDSLVLATIRNVMLKLVAERARYRRTLEQPHLVWAAGQHSVGIDPEAEDRRIRPVYLAAMRWRSAGCNPCGDLGCCCSECGLWDATTKVLETP